MTKLISPHHLTSVVAGSKPVSHFSLRTPQKRESCTIFGAYAPENDAIYWKSSKKSDAKTFKAFLHQLRANCKKRCLALIVDNASIHRAKTIKDFSSKFPTVHIFNLPTYSPEYNPIEQFWKWLKQKVHGTSTITGGIQELLHRIRKLMFARNNNRLTKPFAIGVGIWKSIV